MDMLLNILQLEPVQDYDTEAIFREIVERKRQHDASVLADIGRNAPAVLEDIQLQRDNANPEENASDDDAKSSSRAKEFFSASSASFSSNESRENSNPENTGERSVDSTTYTQESSLVGEYLLLTGTDAIAEGIPQPVPPVINLEQREEVDQFILPPHNVE